MMEIYIDIKTDATIRGATEVRYTDDGRQAIIYHEAPISGFSEIDAGFEEMYALVTKSGIVDNFNDIIDVSLLSRDVRTTLRNCIYNIFLTAFHRDSNSGWKNAFITNMKDISEWITDKLAVNDNISMSSLFGSPSLMTLEEFNSQIASLSADNKGLGEIKNFFKNLFNEEYITAKQLPTPFDGSYTKLLSDSLRGAVRIPDSGLTITSNMPQLPSRLLRDVSSTSMVAEHFINNMFKITLEKDSVR